jgi:hypothetical protein
MTISYLESTNLLQNRGQISSISCIKTALFTLKTLFRHPKLSLRRLFRALAPRLQVTRLTLPCNLVCVS